MKFFIVRISKMLRVKKRKRSFLEAMHMEAVTIKNRNFRSTRNILFIIFIFCREFLRNWMPTKCVDLQCAINISQR
jgi:hypothetical protein